MASGSFSALSWVLWCPGVIQLVWDRWRYPRRYWGAFHRVRTGLLAGVGRDPIDALLEQRRAGLSLCTPATDTTLRNLSLIMDARVTEAITSAITQTPAEGRRLDNKVTTTCRTELPVALVPTVALRPTFRSKKPNRWISDFKRP